jgi:hypothetical protein
VVTLTIHYADGTPDEIIEAERLDCRFNCLGYVLPGESVTHGIPFARIDHYHVTFTHPVTPGASAP